MMALTTGECCGYVSGVEDGARQLIGTVNLRVS